MNFIVSKDIEHGVIAKLLKLGIDEPDNFILENSIEKVKLYIINKSNQKQVPENLKYVWIERVIGDYLVFMLRIGKLKIDALDFGRIAKEISEGDTKVAYDNTKTSGDKFEVYTTYLQTYNEDEIKRYRRLAW